MKIKIACTLEGRDWAVVKSVLNIKNEYEGHIFQFVEDVSQCDFIIIKELNELNSSFFVLTQANANKTPILPTLNPKSLRELFVSLAAKLNHGSKRLDQLIQFKTTEHVLFDYVRSESTEMMVLTVDSITVVLDRANDICHSSVPLQQLFVNHSNLASYEVSQFCRDAKAVSTSNQDSCKMSLFCWNMGLTIETSLIDEQKAKQVNYKLVTWPNFGKYNYLNEFIDLNSLIWTHPKSVAELVERTGFDESLVQGYLNALLLTSHVDTITHNVTYSAEKPTQKLSFFTGLKMALGI